jgi:hypothetical protein
MKIYEDVVLIKKHGSFEGKDTYKLSFLCKDNSNRVILEDVKVSKRTFDDAVEGESISFEFVITSFEKKIYLKEKGI